jgi:acyl carrier protein
VLDALVRERHADFLVLCSAVASVVGGAGQVDYVAANAFLDSLARRNASSPGPFTLSIGWDAWSEVGMAVETAVPRDFEQLRREALAVGILSSEGAEAFDRILGRGLPQILTSTIDLGLRLELAARLSAAAAGTRSAAGAAPRSSHGRPELKNAYVAPRNEVETAIAEIWKELLGFERIGVDDSFFELGGHSLLATQLTNRLRETFQVPVRLEKLFEAPTVAELAQVIVESEARPGQVQAIAQLLETVAAMSPEEMRAMLRDGSSPGERP